MKRWLRAASGAVLAPIVALVVLAVLTPLPEELRRPDRYAPSLRVLDRDGRLLREVRADDATRARWVPLAEVGDLPVRAILAAEDRHFYRHVGVDPIAVGRAAVLAVYNRRVVSGASTLTMQLARLVRPHRRNLGGKIGEMALALRIEASLSKQEILEEYMNRAPFGPGLRGIGAGAAQLLDKEPAQLSLAEAATLAAIPRGPAVYDVAKHPERVLRRRDRILVRMEKAGLATEEAFALALAEPLTPHLGRGSFGAPHFVLGVVSGRLPGAPEGLKGRASSVTTTLSRELQREAEIATATTVRSLRRKHVSGASVVVLDNTSGDILAYVGSPDFFDAAALGQNDGVRALRQPGSTLKPFLYGLAIDRDGASGATLLADVETQLPVATGTYVPRNYDERFHGPVRLREALGNSYNVPAVRMVAKLGTGAVLEQLHSFGFASLTEPPEHYGPALALGDGEVTLLELATAYATLARGGAPPRVASVKAIAGQGAEPTVLERTATAPVVRPSTAHLLTDLLSDSSARASAFGLASALDFPFAVAAKTGTSKGFRDNWTVGYTREVTVAVWVGNFDGSAMEGTSGISGAGPLFHAVMNAAMRDRTPTELTPDLATEGFVRTKVCALSGAAPSDTCPHTIDEWLPSATATETCTMHVHVAIDTRTGLRAGPGCPPSVLETRTFEEPGPELAAWARTARRPMAPERFSPLCPGAFEASANRVALRIGHPRDGARYLLDGHRPRSEQRLLVRVESPTGAGVSVRVDGRTTLRASANAALEWPLEPGAHVLVAEAPGFPPSAPVHVLVE